jgi:hypothetical protein
VCTTKITYVSNVNYVCKYVAGSTNKPRASDLFDNKPYVFQTEMMESNATKRKVGMYSSKSNYKSEE